MIDYHAVSSTPLTAGRFLEKYGHSALTVNASQPLIEASVGFADQVNGKKYSIAVVLDDEGKVCGVLSLGDIVFALYRHREKIFGMTVGSVMTGRIHAAKLSDNILTLLERMAELDIRHMPVVEDGLLKGLVTRKDALEGLYDEAAFELKYLTQFVFRSGARY